MLSLKLSVSLSTTAENFSAPPEVKSTTSTGGRSSGVVVAVEVAVASVEVAVITSGNAGSGSEEGSCAASSSSAGMKSASMERTSSSSSSVRSRVTPYSRCMKTSRAVSPIMLSARSMSLMPGSWMSSRFSPNIWIIGSPKPDAFTLRSMARFSAAISSGDGTRPSPVTGSISSAS